eukprot:jgi/Mesvir1/22741/Mv14143-RA.1
MVRTMVHACFPVALICCKLTMLRRRGSHGIRSSPNSWTACAGMAS